MKIGKQMENLQDHKLKKIRELKQEEYGNFSDNMNSIGQMWSALLGLPKAIPGYMVSLMYVAAKMIRAKKKFKAIKNIMETLIKIIISSKLWIKL